MQLAGGAEGKMQLVGGAEGMPEGMANLCALGLRSAAAQIAAGDLTSEQLTLALIQRAHTDRCHMLNAFITLDEDMAMAAADSRDVQPGMSRGPLHGVPIVVKDNIVSTGLPTTAGTPALEKFHAKTNAPVLQKLLDAGALVLGKTNMHELAFGITSNNAAFGAVGNAHRPTCFAGGSSGGTATAVASGMAPAGLGTDTGGSMRIPAALNGVVGFRPTTGRYPSEGIVPLSHTNDTPGPMARSVDDIVLLDGVITDSPLELEPKDLSGLKLGLPAPFVNDLDSVTASVFEATKAKLQAAGVELIPIDLEEVAELDAKTSFPIVLWEAGRNLRAFLRESDAGVELEDIAEAIASPDVKATFDGPILGESAIPDEVYAEAIGSFRPQMQLAYAKAFRETGVAALLFPTTPLPAQSIEGSDTEVTLSGKRVPTFPTFVRNTLPGATAGLPGLTVNCGWTPEQINPLPIGLEIDGPALSDRELLAIGLAIERVLV